MLTIIEDGDSTWTVIAADGELRIFSRDESGEWTELSVSEDGDQVDGDKSVMLEELYGRQGDAGEDDEEQDEEEGSEEDEEEPEEPEMEEDEESEADAEPEEEPKKSRRRPAGTRSKR